jgi:hypothetical protein
VFAVSVGAAGGIRDREVMSVATGDQRLDRASVDLQVSTASAGFGREPFELRLLAGGQLLERRRVTPSADGSPNDERFTGLSRPEDRDQVCTVEIPVDRDEPVAENNARRVLVSPAGRKRRLLVIEGAPGFEHSFMTRAFAADPGLEVDAVVRKGKNANGSNTFSIQAAAGRTQALAEGFPARRADLYAYDALVIANIEGDFFTGAQLAMIADFVSERGGGLLVTGGQSFAQRGLIGTPIEALLPVELDDRRGSGPSKAPLTAGKHGANQVVLTAEGAHPMMRSAGPVKRRARNGRRCRRWRRLPPSDRRAPGDECRAVSRRAERRHPSGDRGQRTGRAFDGVRRRGLVALADDDGLDRSQLRAILAPGVPLARGDGSRPGQRRDARCGGAWRQRRDCDRRARRVVRSGA